MTKTETQLLGADDSGLNHAARILQDGGLVSFPTETVYGLGADARNDTAVANIYDAKDRPNFNPLIVHVPSLAAAREYCEFNDCAEQLANRFWPGPLTLVLPLRQRSGISRLVTAGLPTLAIRVPNSPIALELLSMVEAPIAAPSANVSGSVSPTTAAHVMSGLGGLIDAVVDGGQCTVGLESTIIGCSGRPSLLRPGGVSAEAIEDVLGAPLGAASSTINAPGQLQSHYAPKGAVRINVQVPTSDEVFVGFGPTANADMNLSVSGDLSEAAVNLFDTLHKLNEMGAKRIAFAPVPMIGIGAAINDRLRRAAAPRPIE
jgi:L-threonylcarbamoyladenylate synthase